MAGFDMRGGRDRAADGDETAGADPDPKADPALPLGSVPVIRDRGGAKATL
ncbi:MAG TPA: hypothetical protein VEB65_03505 [Solirubrobacterales bacterium]|nr:hypothetical protein [Solirubrobacterales bacterium]